MRQRWTLHFSHLILGVRLQPSSMQRCCSSFATGQGPVWSYLTSSTGLRLPHWSFFNGCIGEEDGLPRFRDATATPAFARASTTCSVKSRRSVWSFTRSPCCSALRRYSSQEFVTAKFMKCAITRSVHFLERMLVRYSDTRKSVLSTPPMLWLYSGTTAGRFTSMKAPSVLLHRETQIFFFNS